MYEQIMMEMQKGNFENTEGVSEETEVIQQDNNTDSNIDNDNDNEIGDIELEL